MKKPIILLIIVITVILLVLFIRQRSTDKSLTQEAKEATKNMLDEGSNQAEIFKGSLEQLVARGLPMQCTFTTSDKAGDTEGKIYVSGQRLRGDFTLTNTEVGDMDSFIIKDGDTYYTWNSMTPGQGTKFTITPDMEEAEQNEAMQVLPQETDVEYSCLPWVVKSSLFEPPQEISFTDATKQLEEVQEKTQQQLDVLCENCNQLPPGEAQDQCKATLGCQ